MIARGKSCTFAHLFIQCQQPIAKYATHSSKAWRKRQANDPFVKQAKREGLASRAAFKLTQIDEKYSILKRNQRVIDLGMWKETRLKLTNS